MSKKTLKQKAQEVTKTATNAAKRVFKCKKTSDVPVQESDAKTATVRTHYNTKSEYTQRLSRAYRKQDGKGMDLY